MDQMVAVMSAFDEQHGGDHYKKLGDYQPWKVLQAWLTPEEFRGYMKGTAIAYMARELDKGRDVDIAKAAHTLRALLEIMEAKAASERDKVIHSGARFTGTDLPKVGS